MSDPRIDADYNVRATVPAPVFDRVMRTYRTASVDAVRGLPAATDIRYDPHSAQALDVWGTGVEARPVFVVIHGGYWRMLSKQDTAFMAAALDKHGVATVSVDYGLAPEHTLEQMVRQVRAAVAWVYHNGRDYGLDPGRIVVGGSSAGGHLAATTMVGGWQRAFGLPQDVVRAVLPISGLFDLRPLVDSFANEWLGLDRERATALSPLLQVGEHRGVTRCVVAVAEHDGAGFLEQSRQFHERCGDRLLVVPNRNHYDVFLELADPDSMLTGALLEVTG